MKRYQLTFSNGATENINGNNSLDAQTAVSLRVYSKHRVVGVKELESSKERELAAKHADLFN